jgi:hypothetical protein
MCQGYFDIFTFFTVLSIFILRRCYWLMIIAHLPPGLSLEVYHAEPIIYMRLGRTQELQNTYF